MKNTRPMNLNLFTMKFPVMAVVSILHRVSGIVIFLYMPLLLLGCQAKVLITDGTLADVAPTMLSLMNLEIPREMTGRILFGRK